VTALTVITPGAHSVAERIKAMQAETKDLGRQHVARMVAVLTELHELSIAASLMGDAIPVGIRERSERIAHDSSAYRDDLILFTERARR
jgi:pyridoxine 5'-phosphate synthase PdxJ